MSLIHILAKIVGENVSLESETSTYTWQVMAFHLKCHGLERERETRPLFLYTGFSRNGSGDSKLLFTFEWGHW